MLAYAGETNLTHAKAVICHKDHAQTSVLFFIVLEGFKHTISFNILLPFILKH